MQPTASATKEARSTTSHGSMRMLLQSGASFAPTLPLTHAAKAVVHRRWGGSSHMRRFKWIEWNLQKINAHGLSAEEVEAAFDNVFSLRKRRDGSFEMFAAT